MTQNQQQQPDYAKPESWQNHGDMNPKRHGGLFIKWERDMWKIIRTFHPDDLPEDFTKGRFYFETFYMEEMDIWVDGQPENGFTDDALKTLDSFSNKPFEPIPEDELPEGETMSDYMDWVIENHIEWLVSVMAYDITFVSHSTYDEFDSDYWGYLENHGIKESEFAN